MAKYITSSDNTVALNNTIPFDIVSIPCGKRDVIPLTSGVLTLRGRTSNLFARYDVNVQANVSIPEGGTVTPIAIGITINGVVAPESVAIVTPTAADEFWHINTSIPVTVPSGCCVSISAVYVDGTEDDATTTPTPSILVRRQASITVTRTA